MSDLISRAALFNALANAQDKGEIFSIIQSMPEATMGGYDLEELFTLARVTRLCGVTKQELHTFVTDLEYMATIMIDAETESLKNFVVSSSECVEVKISFPRPAELARLTEQMALTSEEK